MIKYIKKFIDSHDKIDGLLPKENIKQYSTKSFKDAELIKMKISCSLIENIKKTREIMGNNTDLIIRTITLGRSDVRDAAIIYIDNLIDTHHIDDNIVRPLVLDAYTSGLESGSKIIKQIQAGNLITRGETKRGEDFNDLLSRLLIGEVGLLIDGIDEVYIISAKGYDYRRVTESDVEPVVRGSREAFVEVLSVNIGLIRRRLHSPNLMFEGSEIGTVSKTKLCIAYMKDICKEGLVDEVRLRLNRIHIDGVLEGNYIEEYIQDNPYSIFPQARNTERPDVVAAALLEGRVAIIVENTPMALIVPGEFFSLMQSAEDYYNGYIYSSLIRLLRYLALFVSLFLPSFYVAITTFHQEMVPTDFLISIVSSRSDIPFPAFIEAFMMEITFEILHEAGIRLPRPVGQAVSIVGALVIGQSAIQAHIASPLMVIVVALTGISTFCLPQFSAALTVRIIRFPLMLISATFGLFGLMIGILFLLLHVFSLKSFGKPYMDPIAPLMTKSLKDTVLRFPWWGLDRNHADNSTSNLENMNSSKTWHLFKKKGDS
ncbi:MAG TPA: spore germination protein [Clostridiales bacterium]|nr:MAG: spore gernimation protein GerA [Clostridiales bacterium GWD2_32_19]HCC07006.1 spore germination protein [Clostridiales bacterium]